MLTYAGYIHNYPLPVCNTMIPKPRRKVEVCPKAVHKAIKSICHGGEYTPYRFIDRDSGKWWSLKIKHWMPLPNPPAQGEQE